MTRAIVTVAIPVRNGGDVFARVLHAVRAQRLDAELEILVADSASYDGSAERARAHGARVIQVAPDEFGHGRTRNMLLSEARGGHVALLTQDAEPASDDWLEWLLRGFEQAPDVALVYGPHRARADASARVRSELERWFGSLQAGVERLAPGERDIPARALLGRRGFLSDSNACILRSAWERVPFRDIAYAEDRALALDMLRAGYAKVFEPRAAVIHSHDYGPAQGFRRAFDEARAVSELYGWRTPGSPRYAMSQIRGDVGALRRAEAGRRATLAAAGHGLLRCAGGVLGARSGRLPRWLQRALSLERRAGGVR